MRCDDACGRKPESRQAFAGGVPAMSVARTSVIEVPSGKDAAYENFPVGSFLLPAGVRPHVAVFYAYARAIDDIADSPDLAPEDKIARLDGFERALLGREHRYADWADLIDYCNRSAAPVGRFLLDLHGGSRHGYGPSDALCNALQVLNHLQDCQDDYRKIDRVYLPQDWLREAGAADTDLDRPAASPALRRVLDSCLDGVDALLEEGAKLPAGLVSRRLALESGAILDIARSLSRLLRRRDPLARRVRLGKPAFLWC